jgi:hypothetical protein
MYYASHDRVGATGAWPPAVMAARRRGARAFAQFAARPKLVISERESIDRIDGGLRIDGGRNKTPQPSVQALPVQYQRRCRARH